MLARIDMKTSYNYAAADAVGTLFNNCLNGFSLMHSVYSVQIARPFENIHGVEHIAFIDELTKQR